MANQRSVEILCVMLVLSLHSNSPPLASAFNCAGMALWLKGCVPYVFGMTPTPSLDCCKGVIGWRNGATSVHERRKGCLCLKALLLAPGIDLHHVAALPAMCHCKIGFPIANSTRCST
ncbi:hypothetical protein HPP92_017367 [Vanilla planifolia]|uniref:Bifunctional inhibitor/plant lipid transfer protein/seed storage helical domain-containing protein n=1 Tax=Vanilla planifolia TaxID=51239 RepID=A0A835ULV9_VANPL|nr:hypothetical protein HPP92_017367 [Vanilla planifolia]